MSPQVDDATPAKDKKFPNCIAELRAKMGKIQMTPVILKEGLTSKEHNNLCNTFRNNLTAPQKDQYKGLTKIQQQQWIAQWAMDPLSSIATGFNRTTMVAEDGSKTQERWVTEAQLGGPTMLNDEAAAKILCESGELESRDSRYASLAKHGYKEYYVTDEIWWKSNSRKRDSGVQLQSELLPEEYAKVTDSMQDANIDREATPMKKIKKEPVAPDPRKKELAQSNCRRSAALRLLKKKIDNVHVDAEALADKLPKLTSKGYPESMAEFYQAKLDELKQTAESKKTMYSEFVLAPEEIETDNVEKVRNELKEIESAICELSTLKKKFDDGTGNDIKKITA